MRTTVRMLVILLTALVCVTSGARATELVMIEEEGCGWCARWNADIAEIYPKTPEGRRAPLRRIDVHAPLPKDLQFLTKGRFTPTFVLIHDGREVGRIRGYPGEDFFWGLLGQLMEKLPPAPDVINKNG